MLSAVGDAMRKTMRAAVVAFFAMMSVLALSPSSASAQAAEQGCPPGQPTGFPPGQPPTNPGRATGRPDYPPGRCQLALSRNAAQRGDTVHTSGGGFVPGEQVTLSIAGQQVRSVAADDNGAFSTDIVVPANAPIGRTEVVASSATQRLSANFEVLGDTAAAPAAASAPGRGTLPRTGTDVAGVAAVGVLLTAAGTALVLMARKRRHAAA